MKLLLIDGHYYVYRSFFAIRDLANSLGEPTNAIYGFIKTVRRMLKDVSPDLVAIAWDNGLPQRRVELQPAYKQQRAEMPSTMRPQLELIHDKLVPLMGFPAVECEDTEADDLMAAYACAARAKGYEVVLATNDKDLFQLVDDKIRVYTTNKTELASPKDSHALLGVESVRKKWGVEPAQIADVLALIGDTVDNIPGVPGMGPKGAATLISEFGTVERLLENVDAIKKEGVREKIRNAREQILQNRCMVGLDTHLDLPIPLDELKLNPDYPKLIEALQRCEFKSLMLEIQAEAAVKAKASEAMQGELF